ncbi:MAG TPA: hypothetical protein VGF29_15010 [Hyphomicrobiaceae bacterium]
MRHASTRTAAARPGRPPARRRLSLLGAFAGAAAVAAAALAAWTGGASAQPTRAYSSAQAAIDGGLGAYQSGRREAAIAALTEAAARGDASEKFVAEFYLARIYSQNLGGGADHTKAFVLFRKLADENVNVDPETSQRAPFVAKALIALAGYVRAGIKEIDLPPNPARATDYLDHAAVFFGDKDAQYELARIYLGGDGSSDDVRRGLHYLSALTEESYAPAQAVLADLFWRGRYVKKDERRALALATMATEGAPAHERIWIEDAYATIFCASNPAAREEAGQLVARWRRMFAPPVGEASSRMGLGARELLPERQCASGEKVALGRPSKAQPPAPAQPPTGGGLLKGAAAPVGFHAAGFIEAAAAKK